MTKITKKHIVMTFKAEIFLETSKDTDDYEYGITIHNVTALPVLSGLAPNAVNDIGQAIIDALAKSKK